MDKLRSTKSPSNMNERALPKLLIYYDGNHLKNYHITLDNEYDCANGLDEQNCTTRPSEMIWHTTAVLLTTSTSRPTLLSASESTSAAATTLSTPPATTVEPPFHFQIAWSEPNGLLLSWNATPNYGFFAIYYGTTMDEFNESRRCTIKKKTN